MANHMTRKWFRAAAVALAMGLAWTASIGTVANAATPPARTAPSFDCAKATQEAEKLVCASPELSALDHELQIAYMAALAHVERDSVAALKKEQRNWIRYVRNVCPDSGCLHDAYASRITLLRKNETIIDNHISECSAFGLEACGGIVTYRDPTIRMKDFNASIRANHAAGRIVGCDRLIDIAVGTAHGNHRFGGYCTLDNRGEVERVAVCNDVMLDRFAMVPITVAQRSERDLIRFTSENCPGG